MARLKERLNSPFFGGVERFYCELDLLHFSINIKLFIMNKKFTTLVASALLAIGSFSGNAATLPGIPSLDLGTNKGLYQLQVADGKFLAIENDSLKLLTTPGDLTLNTLWCVDVQTYDQGQAIKFEFRNKATSQVLEVSQDYLKGVAAGGTTADLEVGGAIGGWAFSNAIKPLQSARPLYYYFSSDSVVALNASTVIDANSSYVNLKKFEAEKENTYSSALQFTLVEAAPMTLTASQINTILGTQEDAKAGVKLSFDPDKNGTTQINYFTDDAKFLADTTMTAGAVDPTWVRILKKDSSYVYVDTAYINQNGEKFLAFAEKKFTKAALKGKTIADTLGVINDQSKFTFTYWPSIDSLVIQVKQATYDVAGDGFANDLTSADQAVRPTVTGNKSVTNTATDDKNYVTIQDLVKADEIRIVTIYGKKETKIKFNLGTCAEPAPTNKISIEEGLYLIKNKAGKYLAMPIHEDSTYHWVSLEANVNPWDMPSFQWVVEKTRKGSDISPISIINREFGAAKGTVTSSMQLYNDADAVINGEAVEIVVKTVGEANADKAGFQKATAAIMANKYLGYRYLDKDSLTVTTYKLKYWTSFASDDLYMGAMKSGDSVIYVGAKDNYVLASTGNAGNYGYKGNVSGLSQLVRQAYTMKSKGSDKMVVEAGENRIAVSDATNAQIAKFFFKANNNVEGTIYYALVDTAYKMAPDSLRKVGVDENNKYLKRQVMTETRTSAFTVEVDNAPLYRRFNSTLEGVASDATDTLRFFEKYRNEFLQLEANEHFMVEGIEFLGIDAADKAKDGLSFIVDTAWVERAGSRGYIKPQYLVSLASETAPTITIVERCPVCQALIEAGKEAPEHCIHDKVYTVPGHVRGHYLVNFVDSVATNNSNNAIAKDYNWGKYSRAGFVDGVHVGDSLYLLIGQFAGIATKDIDLSAIKKANDKYIADGGAKDRNGNGYYIKDLRGDAHKAYTWSFRYVDTDAAVEEIEEPNRSFLFESLPLNAADVIAPSKASWLKMQNGCLVMSDANASTFNEVITGGDDALIFNVEPGSKDDIATDAIAPEVSTISVTATEGAVVIKGAAGKTVTISNVLGQTIANTVISSSEDTISVPEGVVFVAVEGEAAVKAIVK